MTRFTLCAVLLSLVAGCEYQEPSRLFQVSKDFDDSQFSMLQEEADKLCAVTEGKHCFEMTREKTANQVLFNRELLDRFFASGIETEPRGKILIILDRSVSASVFRRVARHELGHAAGCGSELVAGNVMAWTESKQSETWTAADLRCID